MSEATLHDPHARATQNRWYLFFDRHRRYGDGYVRAVIEEVADEIYSGDGGPTRQRRRVFLDAQTLDELNVPRTVHDDPSFRASLGGEIEEDMDDAEFQRLIDEGTIILISGGSD